MTTDIIHPVGKVEIIIDYKDGRQDILRTDNKVLVTGRQGLVDGLANAIGGTFTFYVNGIVFGSQGTVGGTPRFIDDTRTGLFGPVILSKGVLASIDQTTGTSVTFTSVITFDELVGNIINESALVFAEGSYYSMVTFGDITKTSSMQLTVNWTAAYM